MATLYYRGEQTKSTAVCRILIRLVTTFTPCGEGPYLVGKLIRVSLIDRLRGEEEGLRLFSHLDSKKRMRSWGVVQAFVTHIAHDQNLQLALENCAASP